MLKKFKTQFPKSHYYKEYDTLERFISYFYQVDLVKKLEPKKVLEVGVGNKTVANYLKQSGIDITTCDYDESLGPDYVGDVRELPFEENSYDAIIACEVLEHIPWRDVEMALSELYRVTKKYVVISIPSSEISLEFVFKFPLIRRILRRPFVDLCFRVPLFLKEIKLEGGHYWEIGRKNYPSKKVRRLLRKKFRIMKEARPVLNPYHHFFILKKRKTSRAL